MRRFEEAVRAAVDAIPARYQPYLERVEIVVAHSSPDGPLGLYRGAGMGPAGQWPGTITIYKEPHETRCRTWEDLLEEVRRTVLHEVGHHFQMDEDELPF
jgi:predicted Zn-dependent protease with MMP-like domain